MEKRKHTMRTYELVTSRSYNEYGTGRANGPTLLYIGPEIDKRVIALVVPKLLGTPQWKTTTIPYTDETVRYKNYEVDSEHDSLGGIDYILRWDGDFSIQTNGVRATVERIKEEKKSLKEKLKTEEQIEAFESLPKDKALEVIKKMMGGKAK